MIIRKKGKWSNGESKYVIEDNGKYIKTLPQIKDLLELLCLENTSRSIKETKKEEPSKDTQKFVYDILSEPQKQDVIKTDKQKAKEELDKLFKDIIPEPKLIKIKK